MNRYLPFLRWRDQWRDPHTVKADLLAGLTGAVVVLCAGCNALLRDPARHVLDHQLLFGEIEIHGAFLIETGQSAYCKRWAA